MEIDIVYLWVDGNEPSWLARKNAFLGIEYTEDDINCKGRFVNNDELKYSLRSAEKFAPWIRKIFIVTDRQIPAWLDLTHPKIQIIDHTEILPPEALPCYNSSVIEYFLYRIPTLSEHFLYANDDMLFNADVSPGFFFEKDGYPIVRLQRKPFAKWSYRIEKRMKGKLSTYKQQLENAITLIDSQFHQYYPGIPHHNMDAYRKSDCRAVTEQIFSEEITACIPHHLRSSQDIQRVIFLYYALAIGHGHLKFVNKTESCVVRLQRKNYKRYLDTYHPKLMCVNDSQRVSDEDRKRMKLFLEQLFPQKSSFET
ncbi:MAG: Stealth CR1 domain-containing protein [Candidatus Symbiothrix sp.]|jgi:hypothetical protein|nr:Stealth CR1 domain-containing protein [Candidatus Symbiothrix sp.]